MLKDLKDIMDNMCARMRNWIREIETINENKMEMLEMRNTTSEVSRPFDRMENKLDKAGKRINELENRTIGISLNENISEATEMFYMFFSVAVTQVYTTVKLHQLEPLRFN